MPRGGSRKHAPDCKCGDCPKLGRPKAERSTNTKVADRVLKEVKAERLWVSMVELEKHRLGIGAAGQLLQWATEKDGTISGPDYPGRFSILPLVNLLRYLEDRAYGRPMDTVNHLHDKPLEMTVTHTLSERMRIAMEKAEKRVSGR
jgi:hypothetical protein